MSILLSNLYQPKLGKNQEGSLRYTTEKTSEHGFHLITETTILIQFILVHTIFYSCNPPLLLQKCDTRICKVTNMTLLQLTFTLSTFNYKKLPWLYFVERYLTPPFGTDKNKTNSRGRYLVIILFLLRFWLQFHV